MLSVPRHVEGVENLRRASEIVNAIETCFPTRLISYAVYILQCIRLACRHQALLGSRAARSVQTALQTFFISLMVQTASQQTSSHVSVASQVQVQVQVLDEYHLLDRKCRLHYVWYLYIWMFQII